MWSTVTQISTGITLAAFLAAVAAAVYRNKLSHRVEVLQTLPAAKRAEALNAELNVFGIRGDNLTRDQQYQLALRELSLRKSKMAAVTGVVVLIALGAAAITAYSIFTHAGARVPDDAKGPGPAFSVAGVIDVEARNPPPSLRVGLIWAIEDDEYGYYNRVSLEGPRSRTGKTNFTLTFPEKQPEDRFTMFLTKTGFKDGRNNPGLLARVAVGMIIAYEDTNGTGIFEAEEDRLRGAAENYAIVYFAGSPHPDMTTLRQLHQGYQLTKVVRPKNSETPFDDLIPVDPRTSITVRIPEDPESVRLPNWS